MSETNRRDFVKILGIGSAAGLAGCTRTAPDTLTPYVVPPEEMVRGHALWYRATCRECPAGCGIEARVREGRVHKVEGNPEHPVNGGGLCSRGQAAVQGLYNPDRLRTPLVRGAGGALQPASWQEALDAASALLAKARGRKDAIGFMTGASAGALDDLAADCLKAWNSARRIRYEPVAYDSVRAANALCFDRPGLPVLRFAEARAIYVFGADPLETYVSPAGYTRGITEARRAGARMVFFGSRLSLTGARADEWVAGEPGRLAMALVRELTAGDARFAAIRKWAEPFTPERAGLKPEVAQKLVREIRANAFLAVAGGVAASDLADAIAVNLLNHVAGAINKTVRFDRASSLDTVSSVFDASGLDALLVVDANPFYTAPPKAAAGGPKIVALSSYPTETTAAADIVLPIHTPLESWGDYEPWAGIHSLQQPAMLPVFETRDAGDVLLKLSGASGEYRDYIRARWKKFASADFESFWKDALKRGGHWEDAPAREVRLTGADLSAQLKPLLENASGYMLQTYASLAHFDGRGANRPWLQEMPDPLTQVVWDSWAEVNPDDARKLGVKTGDRVRLRTPQGQLQLAAYVYPGILPGTVAVPLGQGHTNFGRYANGVGVNAAALVAQAPDPAAGGVRWSGGRVEIERVDANGGLVVISGHDLQESRGIARSRLTGAGAPAAAEKREEPELSIYPEHEHKPYRWAMAIDLDACTGCGACIAACYAENNVPVVGKEEAARGREMSWIRLERFFGPGETVSAPFQVDLTLMLCQQCDGAPCEPVCPVFAAYHTQEGLNGQIYNRCVGTRYCSNNCPYKTRRFNWFQAEWAAPLDWQLNPDVTARTRGVMEKCTFCVQRIVEAKDRARREARPLADGDIAPACAQSCPAAAIVFGNVNDPASRIARLQANDRRYRALEELNTRPAVSYLERERRI